MKRHKSYSLRSMGHNWQLYAMALPAVVLLAVFSYYPMYGVLLAFRAFMEVPLLLGLTRLRRRFRMSNLIMVAAGLMAL